MSSQCFVFTNWKATEELIPILSGRNFFAVPLNQYVVAAYLAPRYCMVMHASNGNIVHAITIEIERIISENIANIEDEQPQGNAGEQQHEEYS